MKDAVPLRGIYLDRLNFTRSPLPHDPTLELPTVFPKIRPFPASRSSESYPLNAHVFVFPFPHNRHEGLIVAFLLPRPRFSLPFRISTHSI